MFLADPDSVSQTEKFQSIMRLHSLNLHLQNALYLERQGVLDENLRKTISMAVYSGLKQPGFYFFGIKENRCTLRNGKFL